MVLLRIGIFVELCGVQRCLKHKGRFRVARIGGIGNKLYVEDIPFLQIPCPEECLVRSAVINRSRAHKFRLAIAHDIHIERADLRPAGIAQLYVFPFSCVNDERAVLICPVGDGHADIHADIPFPVLRIGAGIFFLQSAVGENVCRIARFKRVIRRHGLMLHASRVHGDVRHCTGDPAEVVLVNGLGKIDICKGLHICLYRRHRRILCIEIRLQFLFGRIAFIVCNVVVMRLFQGRPILRRVIALRLCIVIGIHL